MGKTANALNSRWVGWLRFVVTVAICGGMIASPWGPKNRPAQDVAIAFVLPLILFETVVGDGVVRLLHGVVRLLYFYTRKYVPHQDKLLSVTHSADIHTATIGAAEVLLLCFILTLVAGLSMFLASLLYPVLGVSWAAPQAREIGLWWLLVPSAVGFLISFATGLLVATTPITLLLIIRKSFEQILQAG